MTLGENLYVLQNIIYNFAVNKLNSAGVDATLQEFVMCNVQKRFVERAYEASLLNQVKSNSVARNPNADPNKRSEKTGSKPITSKPESTPNR